MRNWYRAEIMAQRKKVKAMKEGRGKMGE